jgi:predicted phosphate transport protein (TIGR00153 family)
LRLKLIPEEGHFFELFQRMAYKVKEGADAFLSLLNDYNNVEVKAGRIQDIEHEGDSLTHEMMQLVSTTFITPFDRADIHRFASSLDDVLDHIEAAADYLHLHKIEQPLPQMIGLAETLAKAAKETAIAMRNLRNINELTDYWIEIHRLENEGDRFYRRSISELFSGDHATMDVLKWQDIVEEIEEAIDALEDVANVVEGIALKQG